MPQILSVEAHEAFWDLKVTWQRHSLALHVPLLPIQSLCLSLLFPLAGSAERLISISLCLSSSFPFRLASLFIYDPA